MGETLGRQYAERVPLLVAARTRLEEDTMGALRGLPHIDRIAFRIKETESFVVKALNPENEPPYAHPLREIEDQIAGRVIVFFRTDLPTVRQRLEGTFGTVEWSRRQPLRDAEFGYESDHLVCVIPPQAKSDAWEGRDDLPSTFELQLRTVFMHAYSEPQHDLVYKQASDLPREVRREIAWVAASAWGADQAFDRIMQWHAGRPQTKS